MTLGHDIAMGLRRAYWPMRRRTNAKLANQKVTVDQLVVLSLLHEEDGITQQELCRRADSDPNTIRAMLLLMEKGGFLARKPHPRDGRARSVTLTRRGRQALKTLEAAIEPVQQSLVSLFEPSEARLLLQYLTRISEAMAQSDAPVEAFSSLNS